MSEHQPLLQEDGFQDDGFATVFPPPASMKKHRGGSFLENGGIVLLACLPAVEFALVVALFVFAYHDYRLTVWISVGVCELKGVLLVFSGARRGRSLQVAVGLLVLSAVCAGSCIGLYIYDAFASSYWTLHKGATYTNLDPLAKGSDHGDAASITFTQDAFVDTERTLGYMKAGTVYCVAPVSGQKYSTAPQYWAAGTDCCDQRANFRCGAVGKPMAKTGVRILDDGDRAKYLTAIRMAESVYNLSPTETGDFVLTWTVDTKRFVDKYRRSSIILLVAASTLYLLCSVVAGLLLRRILTEWSRQQELL